MNSMQRGAKEANEESDRLAATRTITRAARHLLININSLPTIEDVRRIVREEIARMMNPLVAPPPIEEIGRLLEQAMGDAVRSGASSLSMPDELVVIAKWLHENGYEATSPSA